MIKRFIALIGICSGLMYGQAVQANSVTFNAGIPVGVSTGSASNGQVGGVIAYYWIVTDYPEGKVAPNNPILLYGNNQPSPSFPVSLSWDAPTDASISGFDILRSTTNGFPASCATCFLATVAVGTNSYADTTVTPGSFSFAPVINNQSGTMYLDNKNFVGGPFFNLTIPLHGGGGGGAVNSVFGRVGTIVAQNGDYNYSQISGTPPAISATAPIVYASGNISCPSCGSGGAVSSVFGRTGAVIAQTGDYNYGQIAGTPSSLPPSGSTGGDLQGTYPNPGVKGINGVNITAFAGIPKFTTGVIGIASPISDYVPSVQGTANQIVVTCDPGTGNCVFSFASPSVFTGSIQAGGTGPGVELGTGNNVSISIPNTSAVANSLVLISGGNAILPTTGTADGLQGIAVVIAGGNATVAQQGEAQCTFDNTTVSGDFVGPSSTTAGDCHDAGATRPATQTIGTVLDAGAAGLHTVSMALNGAGATTGGTVTHTTGALTAGLPVFGNGGADITVGTKTGTGTLLPTFTGSTTPGNCITSDPSGNLKDAGVPCTNPGSVLFASTASVTSVSTTPGLIVGGGVGNPNIPANFLVPGQVLRIESSGFYSTTATPGNITFAITLGSSTIATTGVVAAPASITNGAFSYSATVIVRTSGSSGTAIVNSILSLGGSSNIPLVNTSTVTINTTISNLLTNLVTWSATGQSITGTNFAFWVPGGSLNSSASPFAAATSGVTLSAPPTGTDTALFSATVPANVLGVNGCIAVLTNFQHSAAGNVTYKFNYGTSSATFFGPASQSGSFTNSFYLCGNGTTSTQFLLNLGGSNGSTLIQGGVGTGFTTDSTVSQTLSITVNPATTPQNWTAGAWSAYYATTGGKDFLDAHQIPAANCKGPSTPGNGWSIGSGGTVTCRAGTHNLGGFIAITDTASTFATFMYRVPERWDITAFPTISFSIASTDTTSGTIIPSIQVACYKGDGSTTDDVAPNAIHVFSALTLNSTANQFWSTADYPFNSTDVTGCQPKSLMQITVGRATDTATSAEFYGATITFPLTN